MGDGDRNILPFDQRLVLDLYVGVNEFGMTGHTEIQL